MNDFFFFTSRRRHTNYWGDGSSGVCSPDPPPTAEDRGVGGGVHTAVDVLVPADLDRGEVPGHGTGRRDRLVDRHLGRAGTAEHDPAPVAPADRADPQRSEERRVGKESRSRWSPYH